MVIDHSSILSSKFPLLNPLGSSNEPITIQTILLLNRGDEMTQAICFKCGEIKHGAFTTCRHCQSRPVVESDLICSLALSDHYQTPDDLSAIGSKIKGGGILELDPTQVKMLSQEVRTFINSPLGAALVGKGRAPTTKRWWQFWI